MTVGFNVSLVTFSPNTLIKSADMNSNFTALNSSNTINNGIVIPSGNLQFCNGNTLGSVAVLVGAGSGTYNHGMPGTPDHFMPCQSTSQSSFASFAYYNVTSTQVTFGESNGNTFRYYTVKG